MRSPLVYPEEVLVMSAIIDDEVYDLKVVERPLSEAVQQVARELILRERFLIQGWLGTGDSGTNQRLAFRVHALP